MVLQPDLVLKSHFIITIVLAGIGWIILLGGAGAVTSVIGNDKHLLTAASVTNYLASLWLYIIYQLAIIMSLFMIIASGTMLHYRFAILSLIIISFISNCFAANYNYGYDPRLRALVAGASILAIVNLFWIILIGSEEDSSTVKTIDGFYNNLNFDFTPPNKNNFVGTRFAPQPSPMYTSDVRSNQLSVVISPTETSSPIQANNTMYIAQVPMQNQYSSAILPSTSTQAQQIVYPENTPIQDQNSTTITTVHQSMYNGNFNDYKYKAKALYDYHGSPEDRTELSFAKDDYLDIASKEGKWWNARKADGTTGIAPSNYLSFAKADYLDIASKESKW
ncbi:9109_t:CDS:2 [Dentiscutata erythropus]|uniref:9109_t:CDS:1 n=1 Tax=Dentiscutata erythropus TaxID=1348616 RepID=A0A9N8VWI3_9GLOM|nr:9109_t:CDS:2 [Dentiscutata erythropus]